MSYFVPITDALRDAFIDYNALKYLQVVIDPSGTPVTFVPVDISCDASEDYQKWSFSLKNRDSLSVGLYANDAAIVQVSHDGATWVTVFTGYVSDDGIRRTRGMIHDDHVYIDLHDATKRKGTKRKPEAALLSNFKIVDTANTSSSVLHYLASLMGVTVETADITQAHELIEIGNDTVWAELQRLKEAYHADMFFRYDGKLLFRSPLEDSYTAPSSEWTFQADPDNAVSGNACRVYNKLQEIFLPVQCNYAKTKFPDYEQLALGVIYKHTENYDEASDVISVEVAAGAYWPGPNATDVAKLQYASPDNGEDYPFAVDVVTPTIGATGGGTDIEYTGGTLSLVSFNGSTSATSHEAGAAQIILRNTGATTCTIRKLTVRGKAYRKIDDKIVEHVDAAVASAVDYVEKDVDGKYMVSASQAFNTLYHMVEEGKGRPRRFAFDAPFMPWLQRRAIVSVQPPGESAVRCVLNTYNHRNRSNRTLQGMRTSIVCTELGTYTPTGSPYITTTPSLPAWQAKLTSIAPNASATYRSASTSTPTNPKLGDYWYQTDSQITKRYDGADWQNVGTSPFDESEDAGIAFETANQKVQILNNGTIKAVDGEFSGTITAGSSLPFTNVRNGYGEFNNNANFSTMIYDTTAGLYPTGAVGAFKMIGSTYANHECDDFIQIDTAKAYTFEMWAKVGSGTGLHYLYFRCYDENKDPITSDGSYNYIKYGGLSTTLTKYTLNVQGVASATNNMFRLGTKFIKVGVLFNYNSDASCELHVSGISIKEATPFGVSSESGVAFQTAGGKFKVKTDGSMEATDGTFSGTVTTDELKVSSGYYTAGSTLFYGIMSPASRNYNVTYTLTSLSSGSVRVAVTVKAYYFSSIVFSYPTVTIKKNGITVYTTGEVTNTSSWTSVSQDITYSAEDVIELIITCRNGNSGGSYYLSGTEGFFYNKTFDANDIFALFQKERCTGV